MMTRTGNLFAVMALFCTVPAFAADNHELEKCGTREEAVDYASKCLLAGGTRSECWMGKMSCCKTRSDGKEVCYRNPDHVPPDKVKPKIPPANQQPGQVTPKSK